MLFYEYRLPYLNGGQLLTTLQILDPYHNGLELIKEYNIDDSFLKELLETEDLTGVEWHDIKSTLNRMFLENLTENLQDYD